MSEQAKVSSDEELVEAAQMGSPAALERLVERYLRIVYAIAYARLRQREAAEDLVQEVFLSVYLNLSKLRNPRMFGPWVSRIARNAATLWLNKGQRQSKLVSMVPLDEAADLPLGAAAQGGRQIMEERERSEAVREAIFRLPLEQREMVLMRYIEGISAEEIARRTGVNARTVLRHLNRAVSQMKFSVESLLSDAAPAIRAPKSTTVRTLAVLGAASALSASAKSTIAASATAVFAQQCLVAMSPPASLSAKALALLKTIPIAGNLVTETTTGGLIMTLKAKILLLASIIALALFGALHVQAQKGKISSDNSPVPIDIKSPSTQLYYAVANNNGKKVEAILKSGMSPDTRPSEFHEYPLCLAAVQGNAAIAEMLIRHGANVNLCGEVKSAQTAGNKAKLWPLNALLNLGDAAPGSGKELTAILLIDNGANVNQPDLDSGNATPLHRVTNNERLIRHLVAKGANVNAQQISGETALHTAIRLGNKEAVPILLALGADPTIRTKKGETALDYALRFGRKDIASILPASSR